MKQLRQQIVPKRMLTFIKWLLFVAIIGAVSHKVLATNRQVEFFNRIVDALSKVSVLHWLGLLFMCALNWVLEAVKWQLLVGKIQKVSMLKSLKAVFAGLAMSSFIPYRAGEYLGRVLVLEPEKRVKGALLTVWGSLSQLLVTLVMGLIGLWFFTDSATNYFIQTPFVTIVAIVATIVVGLIFLNFSKLSVLLPLTKFTETIKNKWNAISVFSRKELLWVALLSFVRYLVFSLQYIWLISLFGFQFSYFEALVRVMVIYLIQSIAPTFILTDISIRSGVPAFVLAGDDKIKAGMPGLIMYFVNILIPSVIGAFIILLTKTNRNNGNN